MQKIASPRELQDEIRRLIGYAEGPEPSRQVLAQGLNDLANRLSAMTPNKDTRAVVDDGGVGLYSAVGFGVWHNPDDLQSSIKDSIGTIRKTLNGGLIRDLSVLMNFQLGRFVIIPQTSTWFDIMEGLNATHKIDRDQKAQIVEVVKKHVRKVDVK